MTIRNRLGKSSDAHDGARPPVGFEPIDEVFFDDARERPPEDDDPLAMAPRDPVLERKMSLAVRARRGRLTRLTIGAVGCAALLIVVAALLHVARGARQPSAAAESPAVAMPAL